MLLKLNLLKYDRYDTYKRGSPIIIDLTGYQIVPATVSINTVNIVETKCSMLKRTDDYATNAPTRLYVEETIDAIWQIIQEQRGQK